MTPSSLLHLWSLLRPGVVLRVSHGIYDHVGLVSDRRVGGELAVISHSADAGGVVEEPLSVFAGTRTFYIDGYPGQLPWFEVMARARSGWPKFYSLFGFNCEHFVRYAHGLPVESPQIRAWMSMGVLGLVLVAAAAKS